MFISNDTLSEQWHYLLDLYEINFFHFALLPLYSCCNTGQKHNWNINVVFVFYLLYVFKIISPRNLMIILICVSFC